MLRPDSLGEQIVDHVVGRVLHHARNSWRTTRLLALDVPGVEPGVKQDVGQEVGGERQVLVEHRHVEAGVLLRGERVHLAADRVHRPRDVLGRPGLGALEDQDAR